MGVEVHTTINSHGHLLRGLMHKVSLPQFARGRWRCLLHHITVLHVWRLHIRFLLNPNVILGSILWSPAKQEKFSITEERCRNKLIIGALVAGMAALTTVHAQEKKIKRENLPPAVEKTVAAESQGATTRGFSTEVEGGTRFYEVELTVGGHGKDISIDGQGNVVEV